MSNLTKKDLESIGGLIESKLNAYHSANECPLNISPEQAKAMVDFLNMMTTGKAVTFKAFVGFIVVSILAMLGYGIWAKIGDVASKTITK